MKSFEERGDTFEKKFAHDESLKFKIEARRNKMLGLWAAEKLGKSGEAAQAYAKEVIHADFEEPGDEDVFRKIRHDFNVSGVEETDQQIRTVMQELTEKAIREVQSET